MVEYSFGMWHWLLSTIGITLTFGITALVLIFGPAGDAQPLSMLAGFMVAVGGALLVRMVISQGLVLDDRRLGRRSGFSPRIGWWIDLDDVHLITETTASMQARIGRRDTVLWTHTEFSPLFRKHFRKMELRARPDLLPAVEARVGELYRYHVQFCSLRRHDAAALFDALTPLLPKVPDARSPLALPPISFSLIALLPVRSLPLDRVRCRASVGLRGRSSRSRRQRDAALALRGDARRRRVVNPRRRVRQCRNLPR
jgi:hypothetical protein